MKRRYWQFLGTILAPGLALTAIISCQSKEADIVKVETPINSLADSPINSQTDSSTNSPTDIGGETSNSTKITLPMPMAGIKPLSDNQVKYLNGTLPLTPEQKAFINENNNEWTYQMLVESQKQKTNAYATKKVADEIIGKYWEEPKSFFKDSISQIVWKTKAVDYPPHIKNKSELTPRKRAEEIVKLWQNNQFKMPWEEGAILATDKVSDSNSSLATYQPVREFNKTRSSLMPAPDAVRIGHWNVLNLGWNSRSSEKTAERIDAIAELIYYQNMNLVGLTEIKNEAAVERIISALNILDPESKWKMIVSPLSTSITGTRGQAEHVGIIYQSKLLNPVPFENSSTVGSFYENSTWSNPFIKTLKQQINYVRPPYGAKFEVKSNGEDFTVVYSHNDSPGSKRGKPNDVSGSKYGFPRQGMQEVSEAYRAKEMMEWFDSIDGENKELFYMADTNIHLGNEAKAFGPLINSGFKSIYPESEENKTTLRTDAKSYASPYDKMFYRGKLELSNANKMEIIKLFESKKLKSKFLRNARDISDHAMTFVDLKVTKK